MKLTHPFIRSVLLLLLSCMGVSAVRADFVPLRVARFQEPPSHPGTGALTVGPDGFYWGTTKDGGTYNAGSVYKVRAGGYHWVTVVSFTFDDGVMPGFQPVGGLVNDGKGFLWGTTTQTEGHGGGTVFKVQATTGSLTTVLKFTRNGVTNKGWRPMGTLMNDGKGFLWGVTWKGGVGGFGTVFKVNIDTGVLTTVVEFTKDGATNKGAFPQSGLVSDGKGFLWGTTSAGGGGDNFGTVYKVNRLTGVLTTVVKFAKVGGENKGSVPMAGLVLDGSGDLWGTTSRGGGHGDGTIYKVNATSGVLTRVLEFTGNGASNSGSVPVSAMVRDDQGFLWGTTTLGGAKDEGTVFKVHVATGVLTTVVSVNRDSEVDKGVKPLGELMMDAKGFVWGTTQEGGAGEAGTVYKVNRTKGSLTTVVNFGSRIRDVYSGLVSDGDGNLWGTSRQGGVNNCGAVFKVNPETREVTRVASLIYNYKLENHEGANPTAGLVSDGNGFFWGTTENGGGAALEGTVFKVKADTGVLTTVASFESRNNGAFPSARLTNDGAGFFWGSTQQTRSGEAGNFGTIFKVNIQTGALSTVVEFTGTAGVAKGALPTVALFNDGNGSLWGTTKAGGADGVGTLFKVDRTTGSLTTVVEFTNNGATNKGASPEGELASDGNGSLWGTTYAGGAVGGGTIFKMDTTTGVLTTVAEFATAGLAPHAGLVYDGNGNFFGTTSRGGKFNNGTVFKINATTGILTTVLEFMGASTGRNPGFGTLLKHSDGYVYGTTYGGPGGGGVIYRVPVAP